MSKRIPHAAVSIDVAAPPDKIYELVADITRMGEWSPECVRCAWTKGASGPRSRCAVQGQEQGQARSRMVQHTHRHGSRARPRVRVQPKRPWHRFIHLAVRDGADAGRHPAHRVFRGRTSTRVGHDLANREMDWQHRSRRGPAARHDNHPGPHQGRRRTRLITQPFSITSAITARGVLVP
jgi:hypothetical protein